MASRPTWTGAIELAGFPINVRAYPLVKPKSADSFKTLCPCHNSPIKQHRVCPEDGTIIEKAEERKGVKVGADFQALPPEAVEQIKAGERSKTLVIEQVAPLDSVPLDLATGSYRLVPDEKVPGSEKPANILWNGLRASKRAVITEWTPRSGSRTSLMAIHADEHGLTANTLPYKTDLNDTPEWAPVEVKAEAETFEQFVASNYNTDDFAHSAHTDAYTERRNKTIEDVLAGKEIEPAEVTQTKAAVPDLMAAMASATKPKQKAPAKKAPAKKKAKT